MRPDEERDSRRAWFFASCDLRNLQPEAIRGALQLYAKTAVLSDSYERRVMDREAADQLARELDFQIRAQKIRFERIRESAPPLRVENELPFDPRPSTSEDLDWTLQSGLPFTGGTYAVFLASGSLQDLLAHLKNNFDVCRRLSIYSDASDLHTEEERSRTWVSEQVAKLRVLYRNLADARRAFDADRTGLAIIAWSLGALQVVGWGLLYFVILPQELRAWRKRRAERTSGP